MLSSGVIPARQGAPLARDLCVVYVLLIIYASLHPITSWRAPAQGTSPLAWMQMWPKAVLPFDIISNVAAYLPFGALLTWALLPRLRGVLAVLFATLAGTLLSALLESLQTYLPSRASSLADLAANGGGAFAGALLALLTAPLLARGRLAGGSWAGEGATASRALILVGLWLFAQLFPESMLFGHGNINAYVGPISGYPFTPAEFVRVETAVSAAGLFAAGTLLLTGLSPSAPRMFLLLLLPVLACAVRALSQLILFGPDYAWAWLTPGATRGLIVGAVAMWAILPLTRAMRLALVMVAVTFATVVVNFAPPNPYYVSTVQEFNPGRYLNFNGLTQLLSAAWPLLALVYAMVALGGGERK